MYTKICNLHTCFIKLPIGVVLIVALGIFLGEVL